MNENISHSVCDCLKRNCEESWKMLRTWALGEERDKVAQASRLCMSRYNSLKYRGIQLASEHGPHLSD